MAAGRAAASFLERAAELTPDPKPRATRALAAARAWFDAGSPARVPDLLAAAELGPLDPLHRAGVERLRAQVAFTLNPGRAAGPPLLAAAHRLEALDPAAARETYLSALGAALHAGRIGGDDLRRAAEAAREMPAGEEVAGLFLTGLATWRLDGYASAVPCLRRALAALTANEDLHLLWLAGPVAYEVWDDAAWHRLTEQAVGFARATGALSLLPTALVFRAGALLYAGRFADASGLLDEADALGQATGLAMHPSASLALAAYRGREPAAVELIDATVRDADARGEGQLLGLAGYAKAVLANGLGRYPAALEAAREATEYEDFGVLHWTLGELVEAAARVGEAGVAAEHASAFPSGPLSPARTGPSVSRPSQTHSPDHPSGPRIGIARRSSD